MDDLLSHFYLTLPSDSSMTIFPNNTVTDFKVAMEPALNLNPEEWEVGLANVTVPLSWNNVNTFNKNKVAMYECWEDVPKVEKERVRVLHWQEVFNPLWSSYPMSFDGIRVVSYNVVKHYTEHTFSAGLYSDIQSLLGPINDTIETCLSHITEYEPGKQMIWFEYNENTRYVEIHMNLNAYNTLPEDKFIRLVKQLQNYALVLEGEELLSILGYSNKKIHYLYLDPLFRNFIIEPQGKKMLTPPLTADINAGFHHLFMYCDVVKAQRVGDVYACLLDHVGVDNHQKSFINHRPNPIHYLPLAQGRINTIHVYLRNELGDKIPFTSGKVLLKLHFRKRPLG